MDIATEIGRKWAAFTKNSNGNFIRYVDGDVENSTPENLEEVTAVEAMRHIDDWVVDWTLPLTRSEVAFVRNNSHNFIALLNE